jgi:hypothetical protein
VAQDVAPEFKPQYWKEKKERKNLNQGEESDSSSGDPA